MDGDPRDIVLASGESWIVERNGRTLVHAESPSKVRFTAPPKKLDAREKFHLPRENERGAYAVDRSPARHTLGTELLVNSR